LAKRGKAVLKCHGTHGTKAAVGMAFNEPDCEDKVRWKYLADLAKLTGCPPCVGTGAGSVGALVETALDGLNAEVYCASPSGAFLDR
jgi:hypothetical protein